ncbi:helix-turn-helix domain-containing protein [Muriicola soli]|uniref:AraC family transcriptional regulator n=1 Tax=Muriicola soli TaxID=2507538 RepID=A0A411E7G7_9FLAO|nr:AraC family transcriptional regulator [Muriicola soli]QBA63587.1 AraC family transcriptional regulator [Muriicola soli]
MINNFDINAQVLLDGIGLVQGVTIGILLMIMGLRKFRNTFYLGLFLLLYALELATWISTNSKISESYPNLFLLPFNFSWILFPLFYIYTQQVSVFSNRKIKYWLLYPGIVSIVAQLVIFWLPFELKVKIDDSLWHVLIFWMLGNYYSWIVGIWNLRLLYKHRIEVRNTYSYITSKELRWARFFLIYLLITSVFGHLIAYVFPTMVPDNTIFSVMDLIAIYWVSYFGITQRNVRSLITHIPPKEPSNNPIPIKDHAAELIPEKLEEVMKAVDKHINNSESFMNSDLTIMDIAESIGEHPRRVSEAINTVEKQNFNSYINEYRIKKAISLLNSEDALNWSIEGIGIEVGFKSKSAFYSSFKKFTGTTPTRFNELIRMD